MLVDKKGFPIINGIAFAEGQFTCGISDYENAAIELLAVYTNVDSGMTFGTCPLRGSVFSSKTRAKLGDFLKSAEEDVAAMLKNPGSVAIGDTGRAEAFGQSLNDAMKG
jgi:hypothetical protein